MGENGRIDGRPCQRLHLVFKLEGLEIGIKPERRRQIRKEFWASQSQRNQSSLINVLCTFEEGIMSDFSVHRPEASHGGIVGRSRGRLMQPLGKKQQEMRLRNIKELDFKVYSNLDMIFFLYERRYWTTIRLEHCSAQQDGCFR
jgi:hypothetical protein